MLNYFCKFAKKLSVSKLLYNVNQRQFSIPAPIECPEIKYTSIFIDNKWVQACSGKTFGTINPTTGDCITQISHGEKADIDIAVAAAKKAFELDSIWRTIDASKRGFLLQRLADLIMRDHHYLASLETLDSGKPYKFTYTFDIPAAAQVLRYFGGWADKFHGQTIPVDGKHFAYTRHEPVGICGQIIPWNFPLLLWAWKIGPALATGNTVVLKPAEQTPLTALYAANLCCEAGIPPGVVNIVPGYGSAGEALVCNEHVDKIAFTGSTEVGKLIQKNASVTNLKRITLELGGKSPNIIMNDCDLDQAVEDAHFGTFFNMGQCCCAGTRVYVHEEIYDKFVEKSVSRAQKRTVGNPFDLTIEQGPQIDETQMNKILKYIKLGQEEGAHLATGGHRKGDIGYFIEPTVFTGVTDNMKIAREEIFGPVQSILKFCSIDEVIQRANDSHYGLAGAVFSKNIHTINTIIQGLRIGTVWINCYNVLNPQVPFGGYKMSGFGRDLSQYALNAYTEVKAVYVKVPKKNS